MIVTTITISNDQNNSTNSTNNTNVTNNTNITFTVCSASWPAAVGQRHCRVDERRMPARVFLITR